MASHPRRISLVDSTPEPPVMEGQRWPRLVRILVAFALAIMSWGLMYIAYRLILAL